MDVLQWSRHHRLFPGQGAFDLPGFLGHVLAAGYTGPLSLEVFNDVFRQADPARTAVDAMRSLLWLEEQLAAGGPTSGCPRRPPAPALTGYAFTELAVDGVSGPQVGRRAGRARASPTPASTAPSRSSCGSRARRGCCSTPRSSGRPRPGSPRSPRSAWRAPTRRGRRSGPRRCCAPVLPRTRGAAEADLSAVAAPDGTQVFFARTGPDGWPADFLPDRHRRRRRRRAHRHRPRRAHPAVRLLRRGRRCSTGRCSGWSPEAVTEVAAPFGLVRSRAVTDPDRAVRLALTVSLLRRGEWAPGVPAPAAHRVRAPTTSSPPPARCARPARRCSPSRPTTTTTSTPASTSTRRCSPTLRELRAVLRRGRARRATCTCYTEVLGARVFFEVVQRIGGYDGYGAAERARPDGRPPPAARVAPGVIRGVAGPVTVVRSARARRADDLASSARDVVAQAARRRTFAVISHPDAGKSTLTEALALHARVIGQAGAVHGKAGRRGTVSDWMDMERDRGISITSAALQFEYRDAVINLLDTPGHADFSEDTYRVLTAVDAAVMLIDAAKGLEAQTMKLFAVCRHRGIPVLTVVNKWDRPGKDALELMDEIHERTGLHADAADLAGRHRRRLPRRARPLRRHLPPVHPHRRRRHHRPGGDPRRRGRAGPRGRRLAAGGRGGRAAGGDRRRPRAVAVPGRRDDAGAVRLRGLQLRRRRAARHPGRPGAAARGPARRRRRHARARPTRSARSCSRCRPAWTPRTATGWRSSAICSGVFERGMVVTHARTGRPFATKYAQHVFGRERESIDVAYPGRRRRPGQRRGARASATRSTPTGR